MDAEAAYRKKTPRSARLFALSERLHPGGVSHNIRFFEPYPFVASSARGSLIKDVDGNRYTDYWMGHWSLALGHSPPRVRAALRAQADKGWMHGTCSEPAIRLSEVLNRAVSVAEKIRYTASGTEAVAYAVRMARAITGRKAVAKIEGGWHGYGPGLVSAVNWPFKEPEGAGMEAEGKAVSLPYNDLETSLDRLGRADLACIVVEPLLGGGGCVPAEPDYMKGLQEFADRNDALLVLDEIVTGFRLRYGCIYEKMGLEPDLVTLGKIAGGGMPMGAVCGRAEFMKAADARATVRKERAYVGGGTFSANPASMTAGLETLRELRGKHAKMDALGRRARRELASVFSGNAEVTGTGSLFMVHFGATGPVRSAADAAACDVETQRRYHFGMIARDGIFCLPGKMGAFSTAHREQDVARLKAASERFASTLKG